jgi:hypothetical protein
MDVREIQGNILVPQINSKNTQTLKNADGEFLMQGFWEKIFLNRFRSR